MIDGIVSDIYNHGVEIFDLLEWDSFGQEWQPATKERRREPLLKVVD
jgi:hypothetical protein